MNLGVKTSDRAGMAYPVDSPYANQRLQHAVHRCPRQAWHFNADGIEHLVGSGMIFARQDRLQNGPPLHGKRQALSTAKALEFLKPISLGCRMHTHSFR
jgi:hypothetical protein